MENHQFETSVGYLLSRICRAQRQCVGKVLADYDLYAGQELFLLQLWHGDGKTQSELADCVHLQQATVTRMLDRMAKVGLVERRKDPDDQRISRVYLTEQGWQLKDPVLDALCDYEEVLLANLTTDERILLRRLLLQIQLNVSG